MTKKYSIEETGLISFPYSIVLNEETECARVGTLEDAKLYATALEMLEALKDILEMQCEIDSSQRKVVRFKAKSWDKLQSLINDIEK